MTEEEQIKESILDLESKLLEDHPMMPNLLATIHKKLASHPQLIQALTDEDIAIITKGLATYTKTSIITTKAKPKPKASLKKVSVNDLL